MAPRPGHRIHILMKCWEIKDGLRSSASAPGCLVPPTSHCQPAGRQSPAPSQPDLPVQGRGNYTWGPQMSYFGILSLLRGLPDSPRCKTGVPQNRVSLTGTKQGGPYLANGVPDGQVSSDACLKTPR